MTASAVAGSLLDRVRERLAETGADASPEAVAAAIRLEATGMLGDADILEALTVLQAELVGAGPLDPLLSEPAVSDVLVSGPADVWVDRGSGLERAAVTFADDAAVRRLAQRLAAKGGRRIDDAQPWVDGWLTLEDSERDTAGGTVTVRIHAVLAPVAAPGTCISLRVLRPATHTLRHLASTGFVPQDILPVLRAVVRSRLAFLVVGGTGAGKTTMLSAMLAEVGHDERILCIEDAAELCPPHPHVVRLVARAANVEGRGAVQIRDLVRQSLRMRPDRIVIGEVRGPEVLDLLAALNTGHEGGAGTVHANSPAEVPARLEALAAMGGVDAATLASQLAAAIQVVVYVERGPGGARRLAAIGVVRRERGGAVGVVPAWTRETGLTSEWPRLQSLLGERAVEL